MPRDTDPYDQPMTRAEDGAMPEVPNGTYEAEIRDVVTPYEDTYNPGKEKFHVDYTLLDDDLPEDTWLRKYVNITDGMLRGHVDPKSAYWEVLESAGYDMDGELPSIRRAQRELVGKRVMLTVKNSPPKNDPNGEVRPRIAAMVAARKSKGSRDASREPVAAGARRSRPTDWDESSD